MGIRLKTNDYQSITDMLSHFKEGNEFEASIRNDIDSISFNRLFKYLLSVKGKCQENDHVLDFTNSSHRVTIRGLDNISHYCRSNNIQNPSANCITVIKKQKLVPAYDLQDYNIRLRLSSETEITDGNQKLTVINEIKDQPKHYRMKKRFSFNTPDDMFRIDMTIVKESPKHSTKLTYSRLQSSCEKYEVEVEYIGANQKTKDIIAGIFRVLSELLKVIQDVHVLLPHYAKNQVLQDYAKLVKPYMDVRDDMPIDSIIATNPRKLYVAVKPTTCERRHLLTTEPINISLDYTCTEKADGERMLIYIGNDNMVYMINNRLQVLGTNIKCEKHYENSLFDAEYVSLGSNKKAILLFDAYFVKGDSIAKLPLVSESSPDRLSEMQKFEKQDFIMGSTVFSIRSKKFLYPKDGKSIYDCAKEILTKVAIKEFPYYVDGLIFTPKHLPVGASKPSDNVNFKGTWMHVLKWKPPHDNTIDFLVKAYRGDSMTVSNDCSSQDIIEIPFTEKTLYLYTGHRSGSSNAYDYFMKATHKQQGSYNRRKQDQYTAKLFTPPGSLGLTLATCKVIADANGHLRCKNNDIIQDECIVEMSYDTVENKWIPYRVRDDKTDYLRKTKSISNTANDYEIAVSVWRSIMNPVTKEHITGQHTITPNDVPKDDDRYYARNIERTKSATMPMMTFHNFWVKNKHLIGRFKGRCTTLMDIACGKGGDLSKWINNGYTTVLGVDLFEDNLNNPNDGAYMRLSQEAGIGQYHKYAFVKLDASLPFNKTYIEKETGFNKRLASIIWGYEKPQKEEEKQLGKVYGIAQNRFEVISCQFATHYFFKTENSLTNFISNIKNHIAENGYFIGTCFDGDAVASILKDKKHGESVTGKKNNDIIWSIEKGYDEYDPMALGQEINVYINTINQKLTEYLVGFSRLVKELEKHNIKLMNEHDCEQLGLKRSSGLFNELFNDMINDHQMKNHHAVKVASQLSDNKDEQTLSFLNRWFIFKKYPDVPQKKIVVTKPKSKGKQN